MDDETAAALREHYCEDARELEAVAGIAARPVDRTAGR
jgi:hypothetical protein